MPANGVETAPACLGMDPLTLFDPSDQDTAVKKRNREAQRNHRKRRYPSSPEQQIPQGSLRDDNQGNSKPRLKLQRAEIQLQGRKTRSHLTLVK